VRVIAQLQPLQSVVAIAQSSESEMRAGGAQAEIVRLERMQTQEGEFAGLATLRVQAGGQQFERSIGIVYADESYAKIDGLYLAAHGERFRELIRNLILFYPLRLGHLRRRRYLFSPPPADWQPIARGLAVRYVPKKFPLEYGILTVLPATPLGTSPKTAAVDRFLNEDMFGGIQRLGSPTAEKVFSRHGLSGDLVSVACLRPGDPQRILVDTANLADARFYYQLRLETSEALAEAHRAAFLSVVRSVEPLPREQVEEASPENTGVIWSD